MKLKPLNYLFSSSLFMASSAFWFYREEKDIWTQIDGFEICGAGGK